MPDFSIKDERLTNSFSYHSPKNDQPNRYENLRRLAKELALDINAMCPDSREKLIAIEKLEESIMWANKSIACNE